MNQVILKSAAILGLMTMAACSGGSGGSGSVSPVTPPSDTGPASTSSADLLAYVLDGGSEVSNGSHSNDDITRLQRTGVVDGETVVVTVDQLPDGSNGLIQYRNGDDLTIYTLDDTLVASTTVPSGHFVGAFDVTYSVDGGSSWQVGAGDASVVINTETGVAEFGGMATSNLADGGTTSIEYYSTADLSDGTFSDSDASVVYREDGAVAGQFEGELDGIVLDGGVVGTVGGVDGDFMADGGYTLSTYQP